MLLRKNAGEGHSPCGTRICAETALKVFDVGPGPVSLFPRPMSGGQPSRPEGRKTEGVRGGTSRPTWVMPEPSPETVEDLRRRFPTVVQLPEEVTRSSTDSWLAKGLLAKPLGRRVAVEAVVREIRLRGNLVGEVQGYPMDGKFLALRFSETADRENALQQPWVVNGQPLAVARWRPRFFPSSDSIPSAVVWIRLPWLPVEYWTEEALRYIIAPAGELVRLDECTVSHRRLGFARVAARISLDRPLRPGVIVGAPEGGWWQRFVYEQMAGVCFSCGTFHDGVDVCPAAELGDPATLQAANFVGDNLAEGEGVGGGQGRQELGPWITAVRKWMPVEPKGNLPRKAEKGEGGAPVSSRQRSEALGKKPLVFGDVPVGGPVAEGWTKPSKVARRQSPPRGSAPVTAGGSTSVNPFAMLPAEGEKMEAQSKRARSPGRAVGVLMDGSRAQPTVKVSKAISRLLGQPKKSNSDPHSDMEQDTFHFSAGGMKAGSSPATSGGLQVPGPLVSRDEGQDLAMTEEPSDMTHEDAVGMLRQALQEEGEGIVEMEDSSVGEPGGHPGDLRAEDPSTSTVIHD